MNAINEVTLATPRPKISAVTAVGRLSIRVTWSAGLRAGRTDVVDLSPMIDSLRHYRPLRNNPILFQTVHLIEGGRVLAWGDDDAIDMASDSVEELAEEMMTADDFKEFLKTYNLTHNEAALGLGRSRRQIENYCAGTEKIPRVFVLACFGLVARKQILRGPITRPSHSKARLQVIDTRAKEPQDTQSVRRISKSDPSVSIPVLETSAG